MANRFSGVWSLLCLIAAAVMFYVAGSSVAGSGVAVKASEAIAQIPESVWTKLAEERESAVILLKQVKGGVPYMMIVPFIVVLGTAFAGVNTLICLTSGILSSLVFGWAFGTVTSLSDFAGYCFTGFSDAGGWSIAMMLWIGAFGGVMYKMQAFDPIATLILRVSRKVRHLMTCNALLCLLGNAALSDEMAQITTIGPIIKDLTEKNIHRSSYPGASMAIGLAIAVDPSSRSEERRVG